MCDVDTGYKYSIEVLLNLNHDRYKTYFVWFPCSGGVGTHMVCIPTLEHGNENSFRGSATECPTGCVPRQSLGTSGNLWERVSSRGSLDRGRKAAPT